MMKKYALIFGISFAFSSHSTQLEIHPVNPLEFGVLDRGGEGRTIFPDDIQGSAQLYVVGNDNEVILASLEQDNALLESINGDRVYVYGLKVWAAEEGRLDTLGYGEVRVGGKVLNVDSAQAVGQYSASIDVSVKRAFKHLLESRLLGADAASASINIRLQIR